MLAPANIVAHIVLIDDDEILRDTFADVLGAAGHRTVLARSGQAGMEAIQRERPDLVLCDVHMPGMSGYDVLKALRADSRLASIPFLFLTSLSTAPQVRAGMTLGADDYLPKPIKARDLLDAVKTRLSKRDVVREEANRQIEEMRRSLAVSLPHEMRSPLTTILGNARLLENLHRELSPEEIEETASAIVKAARRLHRLVENHLLYAGLELQRLATGPKSDRPLLGSSGSDDINDALQACAKEHGRAGDLQVTLGTAVLPLAGPYLRKVAFELVDNALKFSEPGTPVTLTTAGGPEGVFLEVVDHGRGMTPEQVQDISAFRQFERALFEQQGSGLGLALVRELVVASGGELEIKAAPEGGTAVHARWSAPNPSP